MANVVMTVIDRIRDLMIADSNFDGIVAFYKGVPYEVPALNYPFMIVSITEDESARQLSGDQTVQAYVGVIGVNILGRDVNGVVDRKVDIPSYQSVVEYVSAVKSLFRETANRSLNGLVDPDGEWAVVEFFVADGGSTLYGYADREDRANNYENYAIVPFIVTVMEAT